MTAAISSSIAASNARAPGKNRTTVAKPWAMVDARDGRSVSCSRAPETRARSTREHVVRRRGAAAAPVAVFQCTTKYPCPAEDTGLNVLGQLRERYGCPVGLSDHSGVTHAGIAAAALGAAALRKIYHLALRPERRPFFLCVSFTHPHDPYATRRRYWDLYEGVDIDLPRVPAKTRRKRPDGLAISDS